MLQKWPIKMALHEGERIVATKMMDTGSIVDTQFPILKGATFCTPGPFGAGKTVLQHQFLQNILRLISLLWPLVVSERGAGRGFTRVSSPDRSAYLRAFNQSPLLFVTHLRCLSLLANHLSTWA